MNFFRDLSIKQKIRLLMILISVVGLMTAAPAFFINDLIQIRQNTVQVASALASVIEKDVSAALAFKDPDSASDTLSALKNHPHVAMACLFDMKKKLFADYHRDGARDDAGDDAREAVCEYTPPGAEPYFGDFYMDLVRPVVMDNERFGVLEISYGLEAIQAQLKRCVLITVMILGFSILIVFLVTIPLERIVSAPILSLAKTADRISRKGNYAIRADRESNDEIGVLVDGFNKMLKEIQARDTELARQNSLLEDTVEKRTAELEKRNREVENANVRLEKSVLHANEMARRAETASMYKSRFLANVSHELRTPLNAVLGYAELLGDRITGEEEGRYLAMISSGGNSLLILISDILDLSRVEAGKLTLKPEPMDPRVMLHDVRRIFSKKISERGLDFIIEADPSLPDGLVLDENRLRQVLINLVGNALKFTESGYIRIEAAAAATRESGRLDLILSCQDTGVGVDADQHERIFNAFQQPEGQSSKYGGAGLGLAISKGLLEMMNGEIRLESEPGKGSIFSIFLKDVVPAAPPERDSPEEAPPLVRFEKASLLVVDDSETNRALLKEMLAPHDFTILEARNGKEALAAVRNDPPDLILMDMKMPVMDGYEATRALKADEAFKTIPVIAVTASVMKNSDILVKEAGCDALLLKPIRARRLVSELMRHLPFTEVQYDSKGDDDATGERPEALPAERLPPEISACLPELLNLLETELAAELAEIREMLLVDEIMMFGEKIERLGRESDLNVLTTWGQNLYQRADGFDVNGMMKALDAFPDLIRTIRNLMERIDG